MHSASVPIFVRMPNDLLAGEAFLEHFALPNFLFHATMAYALLRHGGVELGKMDSLGAP